MSGTKKDIINMLIKNCIFEFAVVEIENIPESDSKIKYDLFTSQKYEDKSILKFNEFDDLVRDQYIVDFNFLKKVIGGRSIETIVDLSDELRLGTISVVHNFLEEDYLISNFHVLCHDYYFKNKKPVFSPNAGNCDNMVGQLLRKENLEIFYPSKKEYIVPHCNCCLKKCVMKDCFYKYEAPTCKDNCGEDLQIPDFMDIAIAKIDRTNKNKKIQLDEIKTCKGSKSLKYKSASKGINVKKFGQGSHSTSGKVEYINAYIQVEYEGLGIIGLDNCFLVQSTNECPFAVPGDSGSMIYSSENSQYFGHGILFLKLNEIFKLEEEEDTLEVLMASQTNKPSGITSRKNKVKKVLSEKIELVAAHHILKVFEKIDAALNCRECKKTNKKGSY
jgi:hypothetical protein